MSVAEVPFLATALVAHFFARVKTGFDWWT
jgi:hypothetical protein